MTISEFKETKQFISVMVFFYCFLALYNIYNVTLKNQNQDESEKPEETETDTEKETIQTEIDKITTTYTKLMSWHGITVALVVMYITIAFMNVYKTVKK